MKIKIQTKIEIEYQPYGEFKGKYKGKIRFSEGEVDTFTFGLSPEICKKYLSIIADQTTESAKQLGEKLANSIENEIKK